MTAYQASNARKARLLSEFDSRGFLPLLDAAQDPAALNVWADVWGFPSSLVHLAAALAAPFATEIADRTFIRELLEAVPAGADATAVPHRWLVWLSHGEPEIASKIAESAAKASAVDIVGLHGRVADGEAVPSSVWRHARQSLQQVLGGLAESVSDAASVIGASAWDYRSTPGAAADVLVAWERAVRAAIRRADGGSDEEDQRYAELRAEARKAARERLGVPAQGGIADAELTKRVIAETSRLIAQRAGPLEAKMAMRTQAMLTETITVRRLGKSALVNLVSAQS